MSYFDYGFEYSDVMSLEKVYNRKYNNFKFLFQDDLVMYELKYPINLRKMNNNELFVRILIKNIKEDELYPYFDVTKMLELHYARIKPKVEVEDFDAFAKECSAYAKKYSAEQLKRITNRNAYRIWMEESTKRWNKLKKEYDDKWGY